MSEQAPAVTAVVLTGIQIPFWSIVVLMVKWTVATLPALFILWMLSGLAVLVFAEVAKYF